MTRKEQEEMVKKTADQLSEHFDEAVTEIRISFKEHGKLFCLQHRTSGWYDRQGMAHEFIGNGIS